jgi:hypothetical protein
MKNSSSSTVNTWKRSRLGNDNGRTTLSDHSTTLHLTALQNNFDEKQFARYCEHLGAEAPS